MRYHLWPALPQRKPPSCARSSSIRDELILNPFASPGCPFLAAKSPVPPANEALQAEYPCRIRILVSIPQTDVPPEFRLPSSRSAAVVRAGVQRSGRDDVGRESEEWGASELSAFGRVDQVRASCPGKDRAVRWFREESALSAK